MPYSIVGNGNIVWRPEWVGGWKKAAWEAQAAVDIGASSAAATLVGSG